MPFLTLSKSGEDIATATVTRWFRQPGDQLVAGEPLVQLEAEHALIVVEAEENLSLGEILVQVGQTIPVGANLARVDRSDKIPTAAPSRATSTEPSMGSKDSNLEAGSVVPILMPQAGNTMEEGTVVTWLVKTGDVISVGQTICEIETDKATIDFESPQAGRLARIVAPVGEPIAVKQPIALLAESDAAADAFLAKDQPPTNSGVAVNTPVSAAPSAAKVVQATAHTTFGGPKAAGTVASNGGRIKASPAARKIAAERGVALAAVGTGSGPAGRILSSDVAIIAADNGSSRSKQSSVASRRSMPKMRRAIGRNLQASKQTIPHFYVRLTVNADPLLAFHRENKPQTECSLNDVIVLAVGRAIGEFPAVRSQIDGDDLVEFPHANIGIAVGIEGGLVVPVVLAVDTLSLAQLAKETKRTVENARRGRLDNIGQGVFTISNLGMFGVEEFSAIINPPESGILAVSAIREAVVVENGSLRAGRTMTMTLSADHRIVDGVLAAKFMARLKEVLEHPAKELA